MNHMLDLLRNRPFDFLVRSPYLSPGPLWLDVNWPVERRKF